MNNVKDVNSVLSTAGESLVEIMSYFKMREFIPEIFVVTSGSPIDLNLCERIVYVNCKNNKNHYKMITKKYKKQIKRIDSFFSSHFDGYDMNIKAGIIKEYVMKECPFAVVIPATRLSEIKNVLALCYFNGDIGYWQFFECNTMCWLMFF